MTDLIGRDKFPPDPPISKGFVPVILSFLLGSGVTGVTNYFSLVARVNVLEARHADLGVELAGLSSDVRAIGVKIDRLVENQARKEPR